MAQLIAVVVRQPFTSGDRLLDRGAYLEVPPITAAVLIRRGVVRFASAADVPPPPPPVVDPTPPRRRRYRRRDLSAEPA